MQKKKKKMKKNKIRITNIHSYYFGPYTKSKRNITIHTELLLFPSFVHFIDPFGIANCLGIRHRKEFMQTTIDISVHNVPMLNIVLK